MYLWHLIGSTKNKSLRIYTRLKLVKYNSVLCSSTCGCSSPLHPSHPQTNKQSQPHWLVTSAQQAETETGQSQMSISCSTRPQDDAGQKQKSAKQGRLPSQTRATLSPVRSVEGSGMRTPFVTSGPGYVRPVQASPNSGTSRSSRLQAVSGQSVRHGLSWCLPSCLRPSWVFVIIHSFVYIWTWTIYSGAAGDVTGFKK